MAPKADPKLIQIVYEGATSLEVAANGDLVLSTPAGELRQQKPHVYQEIEGWQVEVEAQYSIMAKNRVCFQLASYDTGQPLLIDPLVLGYSTYLGGAASEMPTGIAVDAAGSAYVLGTTASINFPILSPYQAASGDLFVTKLAPAGNALVYSSYFGGNGTETAGGIAVDAGGSAYFTGSTSATNFPVQSAYQPSLGAGSDAFVTKLSPSGSALAYSTYLGGKTGNDSGSGIAVDGAGSAYVTGSTTSIDFPVLGAVQATRQGLTDALHAFWDELFADARVGRHVPLLPDEVRVAYRRDARTASARRHPSGTDSWKSGLEECRV